MAWSDLKNKAKQAAASLKAEYEAGKTGEETPPVQLWPSPKQQLDAFGSMLRSFRPGAAGAGAAGAGAAASDASTADAATFDTASTDGASSDADSTDAVSSNTASSAGGRPDRSSDVEDEPPTAVDDVAAALRRVDWAGVRAATAERTSEATRAMRSMADQVDWQRVQPMAAQVSRALIAAVASGQIPLGGALGPTVVRTIVGQNGLGQRVAQQLRDDQVDLPPDYRNAIGTTATEA